MERKADHNRIQGPENYKILIKQDLANDEALIDAAKSMSIPVKIVQHFQPDDTKGFMALWIFKDFQDIRHHGHNFRILGRTAFLEMAVKKGTLDNVKRPLYCHAMCGLMICLTGYRKDEMTRLVTLIHHMGGSVRKEIYSIVTHLIARNCGGEKYQYAVAFRLPVLSEKWVYDAWERRNVIGFTAVDKDFVNEHKRKPFYGTKVCFLGFSDEEKARMTKILEENEGILTSSTDSTCTHVVVNEREFVNPLPFCHDESILASSTPLYDLGRIAEELVVEYPSLKQVVDESTITATHVVRSHWFRHSVQDESRVDEAKYKLEDVKMMILR